MPRLPSLRRRVRARPVPRSARTAVRTLLPLVLACLAATGSAQSLTVRTSLIAGATGFAPEARLEFRELPAGGRDRASLTLIASHDPGLDVQARAQRAFGPLGTVVVETGGGVRLGAPPAARWAATVRGQLGPVAARLEARAHTAPETRFAAGRDGGPDPFASGASLRLAGDGRLSATWIASADLTVRTDLAGAWALDADAGVRARRAFGRAWDALATLESRTIADGAGAVGVAAGVAYVPRRAPEIALMAHLDARAGAHGETVLRPGLSSRGTWIAPQGDRLGWTIRLRPNGRERTPLAVEAWWRPSGANDAPVASVGMLGGGPDGVRWTASLAWSVALDAERWRVR